MDKAVIYEAVIELNNGELEYIDPVEEITVTNDAYPYDFSPEQVKSITIQVKALADTNQLEKGTQE